MTYAEEVIRRQLFKAVVLPMTLMPIYERDLPVGVETIASVICPSITVPAVASRLCDTLYLTNMVIQGDVPADLDPDPSRHDREEEFPPLDDDYLQLDGDPNDIHYVFPPLDHAEDGDHGT